MCIPHVKTKTFGHRSLSYAVPSVCSSRPHELTHTESTAAFRPALKTDPLKNLLLLLNFTHTPSIAHRHLPPNSARFSYTTEGALFISAQLSTDAVSALRKTVEATCRPSTHVNTGASTPGKKKRVPSRFKRFWFHLSWRKQHGQL